MENRPEETELIQTWLAPLAGPGGLNLSDDAACVTPNAGFDLVLTADTLAAGVHFMSDDDPFDIAVKAVTVNLSDLVAKGARPIGYLLALSLPERPKSNWMRGFSGGLATQAKGLLLGGDLTSSGGGPLNICITAIGEVPTGRMVRRNTAKPGDRIYVGGAIGSSAAGLALASGLDQRVLSEDEQEELLEAYRAPVIFRPNDTAQLVQAQARAGLDISDGLAIDLGRLCAASEVCARVNIDAIPMLPATCKLVESGVVPLEKLLTGGDDYVPLFTTSPQNARAIEANDTGLAMTCIGEIIPPSNNTNDSPVTFCSADGSTLAIAGAAGYDHFSDNKT